MLYRIAFASDPTRFYSDGRNNAWPLTTAKIIARNVARKRNTTVTLVKIEEVITNDSPFDLIVNYVDSLKGKALTEELKARNLPVGGDAVASKRQRLIAHLVKVGV